MNNQDILNMIKNSGLSNFNGMDMKTITSMIENLDGKKLNGIMNMVNSMSMQEKQEMLSKMMKK